MRSGGIGASVSSWISENLLEELDHEVIRLSSQDVPTAYAKLLEDGSHPRLSALLLLCGVALTHSRPSQQPSCKPRMWWLPSRRFALK